MMEKVISQDPYSEPTVPSGILESNVSNLGFLVFILFQLKSTLSYFHKSCYFGHPHTSGGVVQRGRPNARVDSRRR